MSLRDLLECVVPQHVRGEGASAVHHAMDKTPRAPIFVEEPEDREEANKRMREANRAHANVHLDRD